jgi:hypothetical protein
MRLVTRIIAPLVGIHIVLASISGYRAIVQIYRADIVAPSTQLRFGSQVGFTYTSSARVWSDAELELLQGSVKRSLARDSLPPNVNPSYDPRPKHSSKVVALTESDLRGFSPGPARLRLTAYGNMQWLRTPPPVVRELAVSIAAQP